MNTLILKDNIFEFYIIKSENFKSNIFIHFEKDQLFVEDWISKVHKAVSDNAMWKSLIITYYVQALQNKNKSPANNALISNGRLHSGI